MYFSFSKLLKYYEKNQFSMERKIEKNKMLIDINNSVFSFKQSVESRTIYGRVSIVRESGFLHSM